MQCTRIKRSSRTELVELLPHDRLVVQSRDLPHVVGAAGTGLDDESDGFAQVLACGVAMPEEILVQTDVVVREKHDAGCFGQTLALHLGEDLGGGFFAREHVVECGERLAVELRVVEHLRARFFDADDAGIREKMPHAVLAIVAVVGVVFLELLRGLREFAGEKIGNAETPVRRVVRRVERDLFFKIGDRALRIAEKKPHVAATRERVGARGIFCERGVGFDAHLFKIGDHRGALRGRDGRIFGERGMREQEQRKQEAERGGGAEVHGPSIAAKQAACRAAKERRVSRRDVQRSIPAKTGRLRALTQPHTPPSFFPFMKRLAILASCILPASAIFAGSPTVGQILPAAAQRGTEAEVLVTGGNLGDARTLLFDEPGIECVGVSEVAPGKFKAKLKVAPDARIGEYVFRAITASGIGDTRLFYVTPYPVVPEEKEDPKDPYKVQPAKLGTTIYGTAPGEDQDHFEIEAKKGQRISAEVVAVRITTQALLDAYLKITDAAGKTLAEQDDSAFTRQDPVLSIIAPADGKYRVILRDSTNNGGGACNYLLHLGSHPRPTTVYPLGGMAGETVKFTMLGDAGGPFEQSVKLPAEPRDRFEICAEKDGITAPQPNYVRVSPFPNVLEVEPNNTIQTATASKFAPPVALNGIIQEKGDVDYFKFAAQKGVPYEVHVRARMLRSPLDPVLEIWNDKGSRLALNDDAGGPDSYVRWTAPADGDFFLAVHDQLMRGGPLFTYRAEITKVEPALLTYLPEMVINSSQQRRSVPVPQGNRYATLVQVKRADVAGDAVLDAKDLPPGVTANFDKVDKSVDRIAMVFEAKPGADLAQKRFTILGKLTEPPKDTSVASRVTHRVEVSENGNQKAYYGVEENALPIAVTEEIPVTINYVQAKSPILQNGSMAMKVVVERRKDFKGPIDIQVLYAPPGVGSPGTVNIPGEKKEGEKVVVAAQNEGSITISANGNAPLAKWKTCIVGTADFGKGPTWFSSQLFDLEVAEPFVKGTIVRTFIDQGGDGTMTVKLEQKNAFEGKAKIALIGLPQGVTSEEREITKDDTEVKFPLKATPTAQVGQAKTIFASFTLVRGADTMTNTIASGGILRVDKAGPGAKVANAK